MANTDRVGLGLAIAGIAAGFGGGVLTARVAAQLVEQETGRVAASANAQVLRGQATRAGSAGEGELTRFKVPVTRSQPSLGPSDALVTVIEWCDLYGESCRKTDRLLSAALERHPGDVRRIFRHIAEPSAVAERAHELACVAHEHGKFWELRKQLATHDAPPSLGELREHASRIGLDWAPAERALDRREHAGNIATDRALAASLDVHRAPSIFVNGKRFEGEPSAQALDAMIDGELDRARELLGTGAARDRIYAEIVRHAAR